jgi:3'-phosphoadenosine 5'-phosphosulfate sulfotransferase (PAPS reductase)/FAD synthetase
METVKLLYLLVRVVQEFLQWARAVRKTEETTRAALQRVHAAALEGIRRSDAVREAAERAAANGGLSDDGFERK